MSTSIEHIIIRHLSETTSEDEERYLQSWLQESEENQAEFDTTQQLWELTGQGQATESELDFSTNEEWNYFKERIEAPPKIRPLVTEYPKRHLYKDLFQMAAGIVVLIGIVYVINLFIQADDQIVASQQIQTFQNMQKEVALEDGSKVWLNENSILTIPKRFSKSERKIRLVGEAFFEVAKDANRPFIILNKDTETRVLGTSFNVKTSDENVEVSVRTGKVSLTSRENAQQTVTLEAGNKGIFDLKTKALNKKEIDDSNEWAWQTKRLVFEDSPLSRVIRMLEKFYTININVRNQAILNCTFNSEFEAANLEEVLEVLEGTLNLKVEKESGQYWLNGKGC